MRVRAALDQGDRVRDQQGAELIGFLIGKDNRDWRAAILLDDRIVGVGEPPGQSTFGHVQGDLLVAGKDLGVLPNIVKKGARPRVAPGREQDGGVGRRGAEEGLGEPDSTAPLRLS